MECSVANGLIRFSGERYQGLLMLPPCYCLPNLFRPLLAISVEYGVIQWHKELISEL
jgi:hypothetical protein